MFQMSSEVILKGNPDSFVEYEVCRNIVGIHTELILFLCMMVKELNFKKILIIEKN